MTRPIPWIFGGGLSAFVEAGHSRHAAAAHFDVSVAFVVKLVAAFRTTGSYAPKPEGGWRYSKLDPQRAFLLRRVAEKTDITMPELAGGIGGDGRADRSGLAVALVSAQWLSL